MQPVAICPSAATSADNETQCVCAHLSNLFKPYGSAAPRARLLILQSKPLIDFWNSLREWLQDDLQGLNLGLKLDQQVLMILSAVKSLNNLCGLFLALPKLRPAVSYLQTWKPLYPRMVGSTIKN